MWSGSEDLQFCCVLGGYYWDFISLSLLVVISLWPLVFSLWLGLPACGMRFLGVQHALIHSFALPPRHFDPAIGGIDVNQLIRFLPKTKD